MRLGRVLRLALDELGRMAGPPALQAAFPITHREGGLGIFHRGDAGWAAGGAGRDSPHAARPLAGRLAVAPHVVQRPASAAEVQPRAQGAGHVGLGLAHGHIHREAPGKAAGDS